MRQRCACNGRSAVPDFDTDLCYIAGHHYAHRRVPGAIPDSVVYEVSEQLLQALAAPDALRIADHIQRLSGWMACNSSTSSASTSARSIFAAHGRATRPLPFTPPQARGRRRALPIAPGPECGIDLFPATSPSGVPILRHDSANGFH